MIIPAMGQEACTSNGTGGGDWDNASTWICTGSATKPDDGNVNRITIEAGDNVEINDFGEGAYFSGAVTLNVNGTLTFDNTGFDFGSLTLPLGSEVNVAAGGLIDATDIFGGSDNIGGIAFGGNFNFVWLPGIGVGTGDLLGPGTLNENSENGVLPILLIEFEARSIEDHVELIWLTAAEENNDYFTIERSSNGLDFEEVATIYGAGNSFEAIEYTYIDNNPFQGVSYYRLKQTDFNGMSETFKVVAAEFHGDSAPIKVVQTLGGDNELLIFNNLDEENMAYIYDLTGSVVIVSMLKVGKNQLSLNQFNTQSGTYILTVVNAVGKILVTQKFLM